LRGAADFFDCDCRRCPATGLYWDAIGFVHLRNDLPFCRRYPLREGAGVLNRNVQNLSPLSVSMALLALLAGYFFSRKVREDREVQGLGALGALGGLFFLPQRPRRLLYWDAIGFMHLQNGLPFCRKHPFGEGAGGFKEKCTKPIAAEYI
jgi:hypothetical protein